MQVAQLTKHKRCQRSFELSEGDVQLLEAVQADCSTALARRWQNSGHRTGSVANSAPTLYIGRLQYSKCFKNNYLQKNYVTEKATYLKLHFAVSLKTENNNINTEIANRKLEFPTLRDNVSLLAAFRGGRRISYPDPTTIFRSLHRPVHEDKL